jgi:hypothetical protein
MKCGVCLIALGLLLVLFSYSFAQVPQMINYQGKLTKASGAPLDTTISMVFSIYADSAGTLLKWTETQGAVVVEKGIFNVLLGSVNPISSSVFNGSVRYLGVKVGTDPEITPRKPMVSVPYAYRAAVAPAVPDNDWALRITDTADTTLITGGKWGIARSGNALYGNADSTHVNFGVACTTGASGYNYKYCTVGGGVSNAASGDVATVGGGDYNTASNSYATVGGGNANTASYWYATVGGGSGNTASGIDATVGGGFDNTASYDYTTVGGGLYNTASGNYATVGGGWGNITSGQYSAIPGGHYDTLTGNAHYSMEFGRGVYVNNAYRVIFFDGSYSGRLGINRDDRDGGISYPIHIGTNTGNGNGAYLTAGGVWTNASSREVKENLEKLDGSEILSKLQSLDIYRWQYKGTDEEHIGPVAEDFYSAFATGTDNKYLSSLDVSGVALRAIQELIALTKAQQEKIELLEKKVAELEK